MKWVLSIAQGKRAWRDSTPLPWGHEGERFFKAVEAFDAYLASDAPLAAPVEKMFQGGLADSLTHIGQISMLRRLAGHPVRGENYGKADIVRGRVGAAQAASRVEFD